MCDLKRQHRTVDRDMATAEKKERKSVKKTRSSPKDSTSKYAPLLFPPTQYANYITFFR